MVLMALGLISIHAERAFPPEGERFSRSRFGMPLFWSGHVQLGLAALTLLGTQIVFWLARPDRALIPITWQGNWLTASPLTAGAFWLGIDLRLPLLGHRGPPFRDLLVSGRVLLPDGGDHRRRIQPATGVADRDPGPDRPRGQPGSRLCGDSARQDEPGGSAAGLVPQLSADPAGDFPARQHDQHADPRHLDQQHVPGREACLGPSWR